MSVNAPVTVYVNGAAATATAAIGYPGTSNRYLVYFVVPAGVTGSASVQMAAALLAGPATTFKVQ